MTCPRYRPADERARADAVRRRGEPATCPETRFPRATSTSCAPAMRAARAGPRAQPARSRFAGGANGPACAAGRRAGRVHAARARAWALAACSSAPSVSSPPSVLPRCGGTRQIRARPGRRVGRARTRYARWPSRGAATAVTTRPPSRGRRSPTIGARRRHQARGAGGAGDPLRASRVRPGSRRAASRSCRWPSVWAPER